MLVALQKRLLALTDNISRCDKCGCEGVHEQVMRRYGDKETVWLCYSCWEEWDALWMRTYKRNVVATFGRKDRQKKREPEPEDLWNDFMSGKLNVVVQFT